MSIEILTRETVYQGRAFNVRRDKIHQEDGRTVSVDIVEHPGAVTILPVDADGNILFIRQYRHAVGVDLLELPAGTLGANKEPLACARREIREETGFAAGKLVKLGEFFLAPGYSTEYMHVYLATDLHHDRLPGDEDEFITLEPMPIERAYALAGNGGGVGGKSLAGVLLAGAPL